MLRVVVTTTPLYGHVAPLLDVARALAGRGHEVTVLTGEEFRELVVRTGLAFAALPPAADIVHRHGRARRPRVIEGREAILETFVRPLPAQHLALRDVLASGAWDVVVSDAAFLGALPLVLGAPLDARVPVIGVSVTPLSLNSVDAAPFGSALQPGRTPRTRRRNRRIQWLLRHGPLRPLHTELDRILTRFGVAPGRVDYFDHTIYFDLTFQLAPAELEYPRREMPSTVRFVGPMLGASASAERPDWWGDLTDRTVVHVTQGTLDTDPHKLVLPAIRALEDEPVLTVVTTPVPEAELARALGGTLPRNTRVAPFLSYDELLPRVRAVVSNGGFGGVQHALRHGVPLVLAGDTEEKPEVAARVRHVGAGIDLRTGRPTPRQVRRAVRAVLSEPRYAAEAARVGRSIARLGDPATTVADAVEGAASVTVTSSRWETGDRPAAPLL